jgi:hypothetical protein
MARIYSSLLKYRVRTADNHDDKSPEENILPEGRLVLWTQCTLG